MNRQTKPYNYSDRRSSSRERRDNYPPPGPHRSREENDHFRHRGSRGGRSRRGRGSSWSQPRSLGRGYPPPEPSRPGYRGQDEFCSPAPYPSSRPPRNPNRIQIGSDPNYIPPRKHSRKKPESGQREFPCRCLFVRNIEKIDTSEREIYEMFSAYGEIKLIVDRIVEAGVAYISFFDLRAAETARASLGGTNFWGRPLDVHFAFPNPNADRSAPPPPKENQGSVKLVFCGFASVPAYGELHDFFSQFGEVRGIHATNKPNVQILSYYDSRACMEAVRNTPPDAFGEGSIIAELGWDKFLPIPLEEQRNSSLRSYPRDTYNPNEAPYDYREPYPPSTPRADYGYQPNSYNDTPNATQELIEKAQQAQEFLNYIQTQTNIKLPETNYYNNAPQQPSADKPGLYQGPPNTYAPSDANTYYQPTTPGAANPYAYGSRQPTSGQSGHFPSNPALPQPYADGKGVQPENPYGYYAMQDTSSHYQAASNPTALHENAPNTEVNQLLQLLAQANSKHGIK